MDYGDTAQVGGKNASHGEMIQALAPKGVRISDGFATTAARVLEPDRRERDCCRGSQAPPPRTSRLRASPGGTRPSSTSLRTTSSAPARNATHHSAALSIQELRGYGVAGLLRPIPVISAHPRDARSDSPTLVHPSRTMNSTRRLAEYASGVSPCRAGSSLPFPLTVSRSWGTPRDSI